MVTKKITKKIVSKVEETKEPEKEASLGNGKKRGCTFCQNDSLPSYTDSSYLKKFLTDRGRIIPKAKTALCSKHQRYLTKQIKYARHLALLPFTPKV